jgi:hypothetical protein
MEITVDLSGKGMDRYGCPFYEPSCGGFCCADHGGEDGESRDCPIEKERAPGWCPLRKGPVTVRAREQT